MKALVLTLLLATLIFFGCGGDEEDETVVEEVSNKTPVISVEKIRENPDPEDEMHREVWFKFTADPAPRKEMLVSFEVVIDEYPIRFGSEWCYTSGKEEWANISKGKTESEELSISIDANGSGQIEILPIPTVDIVGEGKKVDMDKLEYQWGDYTIDDQRIPDGFQFPYYEVGETYEVILYDIAEDVEIVSIDPPPGSTVKRETDITITFSSPPYCPAKRYTLFDRLILKRESPTTFITSTRGRGVNLINIEWNQGREKVRINQEFIYLQQ